MGATSYNGERGQWQPMAISSALIDQAQDALTANLGAILSVRGMKRVDLARKSAQSGGPSKKTVYNILNRKHPPNLQNWAALAEIMKIPLWVLLIPDLAKDKDLLTEDGLSRLQKLVEDYVACDPIRRQDAAEVASAGATVRRLRSRS